MYVQSTRGDSDTGAADLYINQTNNASTDVSRVNTGIKSVVMSYNTASLTNTSLKSIYGTVTQGAGGTVGSLYGLHTAASNQGGGTVDVNIGGQLGAYTYSGASGSSITNSGHGLITAYGNITLANGNNATTTTAYGIKNLLSNAAVINGTASITNAYGIYSEVGSQYLTSGTATITNAYNMYLNNYDLDSGYSAGTITNNYSLYIETPTRGSTVNYSIYSEGGTNYFGGDVGIGTSAPEQKLTVNGMSNLGNRVASTMAWYDSTVTTVAGLSAGRTLALLNYDTTDRNVASMVFEGNFYNEAETVNVSGAGAGIGAQFMDHHNDALEWPTDLYFWTGNVLSGDGERMRITATGNIGIGTTSPLARL